MGISKEEREAIMAMSEEELSALELEANRNIEKLLGQLKANMSEDQQRLVDRMVEAEKRKVKRELDAQERPKSSFSPELRDLIREANNSNRHTPIPWRQILSQKASTVVQYRERVFWTMCSSGLFDELPDRKKIRIAELSAKVWEENFTQILDSKLIDLINLEEAVNNLTKDGADAFRAQRMKIIEDIKLGVFNNDKLVERLADGLKHLPRHRDRKAGDASPSAPPVESDIWTVRTGQSAVYLVPHKVNPRHRSPKRRYRNKEVAHGFPVANLREFFFFSRRLASAAYDAPNRRLYLKFDASTLYQYFDVPENVARDLLKMVSPGSYAYRHICYAFKYERLPFSSSPEDKMSLAAERRDELASLTVEELQKRPEKNQRGNSENHKATLAKENQGETLPNLDFYRVSAANSSLSQAEVDKLNAILLMSDEEAAKAEAKDRAELKSVLKQLLGEDKPTDTPTARPDKEAK